jgi:predicted dehydrogenase
MSAKKRIVILSFAHYHANFWAESFIEQEETELAGIWDDDSPRGEEAARRFNVPFFTDLEAALQACDAVAITSETSRHPELVSRALARGKPVLCEKPIAMNLAGAEHIVAAVSASGLLFMQSFPKRLDPASHALRDLVRSNELGRIHLVRVRHGHFYGMQDDFKDRWYVQSNLSGGGALLDEGIHGADFLHWLFGRPESVVATTSSAILDLDVEDSATALFSYSNGMTAELATSFMFAAADNSIEVFGTHGTAILSGVDLASRDITSSGFLRSYIETGDAKVWRDHHITPRFKLGGFHQQNAIAFAGCLAEGKPPPASAEAGRDALLLIERAYDAARTGRRVKIEQ